MHERRIDEGLGALETGEKSPEPKMIERQPGITFAEFIAWEQEQEARHELIGGQIVAFAGGSLDHSSISSNIVTKLRATVEPPCQAFNSDAILETATRSAANGFRADAVVSCSPENVGTALFVRTPLIVVEVLSPSNAGRKWVEKLFEYWNTLSIAQLVLVDSRTRATSSYVRDANGVWQAPLTIEGMGTVEFPPIGSAMSFDQIYAATSLAN
jgi:Uma2 family endonuclease